MLQVEYKTSAQFPCVCALCAKLSNYDSSFLWDFILCELLRRCMK